MNTVRYARWMHDRGWTVKVFCVEGSHISKHSIEQGLEVVLIRRNKKYFDWINAWRVKNLFAQHEIALCWFRDTRDFDLLGWVKRWSHGRVKLLYQQAMQFGVSKKDFMHTFRFKPVDAWISTLNFLADQVKQQTHFSHEKIHVIPLGVDASRWENDRITQSEARRELGLPLNVKFAGIIGRIDPLKGQHIALQAFLNIADQYPKLHLLLVGESTLHEGNAYEKELHEHAQSSTFKDRIHFLPYSKNVKLFYEAIDLFLLCSKGETFGTVTIEAMSFSKPVIATNSSGSPEILDHGNCGLLFEPEQPDDLSKAMRRLLDDEAFAKSLGQKGRQQYERKFSAAASVDAMEKVVLKLMAR